MCGSCSPIMRTFSIESACAVSARFFPSIPTQLVTDIYGAVSDPLNGAKVPEAAWFGAYLSVINQMVMTGETFIMPLSARTLELKQVESGLWAGEHLPARRYVPLESFDLRESVKRLNFSSTGREAIDGALAPYGIAIETFSTGGIIATPCEQRGRALVEIRKFQLMQSKLDHLNREATTPMPLARVMDIGVDLTEDQANAIYAAYNAAGELAGISMQFVAIAA